MTLKWYPVIDHNECIECGLCIAKCSHGVYDMEKTPTPLVIDPEACVDHCHGCGNRCPVGAITYAGENTGWTPPNAGHGRTEKPSSCLNKELSSKKVLVEYLYLDLQTCDRCKGTDNVLDEVMTALTPALNLAGYEVEYKKIEMATEDIARKYQFLSSPTIRVNGMDVCQSVSENNCGCCSDISGTEVDCRVFEYRGGTYEIPPKEMLAEAILHTAFREAGSSGTCGEYKFPENLKTFFEGKKSQKCSCSGNCC